MVLVNYSDSEGSDSEIAPRVKPTSKPSPPSSFLVDKSNPKKILVSLNDRGYPAQADTKNGDGEPPAKRARVGAGVFSGFNAMLPPPKRENVKQEIKKAPTRKVFSLQTGAEPAFSRDSDAELRDSLARDHVAAEDADDAFDATASDIPDVIPKRTSSTDVNSGTITNGKPFLFKPLSVARDSKKKKKKTTVAQVSAKSVNDLQASTTSVTSEPKVSGKYEHVNESVPPVKKISLFSSTSNTDQDFASIVFEGTADEEDEIVEVLDDDAKPHYDTTKTPHAILHESDPDSLTSIADTLNLSAAERRQLLGRNHNSSSNTASRIINFNTDTEYAANQQLNAMGEQVQHNPVRAIAPGKHSLKSLVANAQGQRDALEESFAHGKRNKREAGNKYGW